MKVAALAGKAQHAQRHVNNGVDIVIAQGYEAGGHTGEIATMVLVPEVVKAVSPTPVLAAGGIGTGAQIAASLALGAQGVWTGSLWLTTAESSSSPEGLEAYLEATSSDTVRSRSYTGKPARMLRNAWTDAWEDPTGPGPLGMPLQNILTAEANARIARAHRKDLVFAPVGQIVGSMNEVKPVRDVMFRLVEEYIEATERLGSSVSDIDDLQSSPPIWRCRTSHSRAAQRQKGGGRSPDGLRVVDVDRGDRGRVRHEAARATSAPTVTKVERPGGDPLRWWSAATPDEPVDGDGRALLVPATRGPRRSSPPTTPGPCVRALDATDRRASPTTSIGRDRRPGRGRAGTSVVTISAFGADGPLAGDARPTSSRSRRGAGSCRDAAPATRRRCRWASATASGPPARWPRSPRWRRTSTAPAHGTRRRRRGLRARGHDGVPPQLPARCTGSSPARSSVMSRGGDWPQIVRCKDGWIGLCIFTPQQWDDFANMIGRPELAGDDRLQLDGRPGPQPRARAVGDAARGSSSTPPQEIFELGGLFRVPVAYVGQRPRRARHGPLPSSGACS